jgi:hypothetical protein
MTTSSDVGHQPPADSIMTPLRYGGEDGPRAIVIGPTHKPYFVFDDGRTEPVAPEPNDAAV